MLAMTSWSERVSMGCERVKNLSKFSAALPHCKRKGEERQQVIFRFNWKAGCVPERKFIHIGLSVIDVTYTNMSCKWRILESDWRGIFRSVLKVEMTATRGVLWGGCANKYGWHRWDESGYTHKTHIYTEWGKISAEGGCFWCKHMKRFSKVD